ncbi:MAG TPA: DEAD/DEAH box helicase [Candidatus Solibacter sp.]|nr:DEAD/DEAH box helicase [Candidatus Solibacter sp.]
MGARVSISLDSHEGEVRLEVEDLEAGVHAELRNLILSTGGLPNPSGFVIPLLAFRRSAVDLAQLLQSHAEVVPDAAVLTVLQVQLAEIGARRAAETTAPLSADDVHAAIGSTGRFARTLTQPQVRDLGRLLLLPNSANFSVPGAGKTTALLAHYEALRGEGAVDRLLVIAPKNAFLSWDQELLLAYGGAGPLIRRLIGGQAGAMEGLATDPEAVILTYQLLPNVLNVIKGWARQHSPYVVLDESHRVKAGMAGVIASAALDLAEIASRRAILSGTPLPQSPEDLRPQLDFLWPGQRIMPDLRVVSDSPEELLADVESRVRPLYVRTTKDELALPPLVGPTPIVVEMGPIQQELYDLLRSGASRLLTAMSFEDRRFFRILGRHVVRLLQAASNPMLLTQSEMVDRPELKLPPEGVRAWELLRDYARYEVSAKIEAAVQRAAELIEGGSKVLIWSSFVTNVMALERLLSDFGPVVLYGQIPTGDADDDETREGRIRRFHEDPSCRVMIANPAACGEGISLHLVCHHAIYVDRTFNAAHFLQSVDRIHRLGLPATQLTTVEVLEARGTIDQTVALRLKKKIDAMAKILNDPGLRALAYDPEDVVEELPAGLEPDDIEEVIDHLVADGGEE